MQQIWSADELQEHWVLTDEELVLSQSVIEPRRLMLCYYLKHLQPTAHFPNRNGVVPEVVLDFLARQIGSEFSQLPFVPKRSDRRYRHQIIEFLNLSRFDSKAGAAFISWLISDVLPAAPNASALEAKVTDWFWTYRFVRLNTLMIQDVLADQTWRKKMTTRDMAALNPLPHSHINPYGIFDLDMTTRLPLNDMGLAA